jgi:hypothetical protein
VVTATTIFAKAFLESLGQHAANGFANLPRQVGDLIAKRIKRKGQPDEVQIGLDHGSSAMIAITDETPDEARLALLDLDVTAEGLRGQILWWDSEALTWRPASEPVEALPESIEPEPIAPEWVAPETPT